MLHELGGEAAASLAAFNADGNTPAHLAAGNGHEGCVSVLHMALRKYTLARERGISHMRIFLTRWWADARLSA